ncbi:hypothetical protein ACFX13_036676 [Malus domestica]
MLRRTRAELIRIKQPLAVVGDNSTRRSPTVLALQDRRDPRLDLRVERDAVGGAGASLLGRRRQAGVWACNCSWAHWFWKDGLSG